MALTDPSTPRAVEVKVAEYPEGFRGDVADLLSLPDGPALFGQMIRNARPGPSWMISHVDEVMGHDLTTTRGQVDACEDMVDVLLRQPPIARSKYVRELAEKLEVPEHEIRQTLNEVVRERRAYYAEHPEDQPRPNPELIRRRLYEA
jgi:DNA primase